MIYMLRDTTCRSSINNMDLSIRPPKDIKHLSPTQAPYEHMNGWLSCRGIMNIPTTGGKEIIMLNLALNFWRECFKGIYLVSPTSSLDVGWQPLDDYIRNVSKVPEE